MHRSRALALTSAAAGAAAMGLGYAWTEARWFTLRQVTVAALPAGAPTLRVLHVSDLHLVPRQGRKRRWLASLAGLEPDLVINTGDNLAHKAAVGPVLDGFGALLDRPGVFVLGSNDYYEPGLRNPVGYLLPDNGKRHVNKTQLPWRDLVEGFTSRGWLSLQNRKDSMTIKGVRLAFAGVDDPHLRLDDLTSVSGPADHTADLRLAVMHAPYLRVLDAFVDCGYDGLIAGHTHGGQIRVPGWGALTTNCDLDNLRARGLSRHPAQSSPADPASSWLHVSAGAGTSPYAVARVACRPEATLLTLAAKP